MTLRANILLLTFYEISRSLLPLLSLVLQRARMKTLCLKFEVSFLSLSLKLATDPVTLLCFMVSLVEIVNSTCMIMEQLTYHLGNMTCFLIDAPKEKIQN